MYNKCKNTLKQVFNIAALICVVILYVPNYLLGGALFTLYCGIMSVCNFCYQRLNKGFDFLKSKVDSDSWIYQGLNFLQECFTLPLNILLSTVPAVTCLIPATIISTQFVAEGEGNTKNNDSSQLNFYFPGNGETAASLSVRCRDRDYGNQYSFGYYPAANQQELVDDYAQYIEKKLREHHKVQHLMFYGWSLGGAVAAQVVETLSRRAILDNKHITLYCEKTFTSLEPVIKDHLSSSSYHAAQYLRDLWSLDTEQAVSAVSKKIPDKFKLLCVKDWDDEIICKHARFPQRQYFLPSGTEVFATQTGHMPSAPMRPTYPALAI